MRKTIFANHLSPGDILMLTAAVRDLHKTYPGEFQTDVRTPCAALWENGPETTRFGYAAANRRVWLADANNCSTNFTCADGNTTRNTKAKRYFGSPERAGQPF